MPSEEVDLEISVAAAVSATLTVNLVEAASAGTSSALRTLTHPTSATFPLVTYNRNPDRTINFDQAPLFPPNSETLRTLGTTQAFVTQNALDDVIVTERWEASGGTASMVAAQFRRMYELLINPPIAAEPEDFVQWAPNDRTTVVYNVILLDLRVGGGPRQLDFKELGLFSAGDLDAVATGLVDRQVELDFKLVSEV